MKIAAVAPTEIPSRRANSIQVMKMCQAFCTLGHHVHLAAPGFRSKSSYLPASWEDLASHYGLKFRFSVEWLPAASKLRGYDYSVRAYSWARGMGADILYTRLPQAAALASKLGMPTILEVHDLPQGRFGPMIFRFFLNGRGARRVVVITQALLRDLKESYSLEIDTLVAPDSVDLERYQDLPTSQQARARLKEGQGIDHPIHLNVNKFTAGYTGHLYPGRGGHFLLALAEALPEMQFLIVGGEPDRVTEFRKLAQERGLGNLVLTGFVPNAQLPLYQAACDVLLMPYRHKVAASSGGNIAAYLSPMKLFEYLASGRLILASDLPVLGEVLNSENAIQLPLENPNLWFDTLKQLMHDEARRNILAKNALRDAQKYTWERRAKRILAGIRL